MSTHLRRLGAALVVGLTCLLAVTGLYVPPAQAANTMVIIIGSINVGNPAMASEDKCRGYMEHRDPVIPVSVQASFYGDQDPVGPYSTINWSGGLGTWDDHFGNSARSQRFHMLVRANQMYGWRGAGDYRFTALVQDVGLAGGLTTKSKDVTLPPPSPTTAKVKCSITPELTPQYVIDQLKDAVIKEIQKKICEVCVELSETFGKIKAYADGLNGSLFDAVVDDPPDAAYQTLAEPVKAPALATPAGLTTAQRTAFVQLADRLATDLGVMRAAYATVNRVWGADNAASTFWHRKQLAHLAGLADQAAVGYEAQPALWAALVESFGTDIPEFEVGPAEVNAAQADLDAGLDGAEELSAIGVDTAQQKKIAGLYATYVNAREVRTHDSRAALAASNGVELARVMRVWADWARSAAGDDAPVVSSVSPTKLPRSGGTLVTVKGARLGQVTGINFGPSDVGNRGQGDLGGGGCSPTECRVWAPAGQGTVDVVAVAPGGTSTPSPAARVTYAEPRTPVVREVFPRDGHVDGGTKVTVFGDGLEGGRVDFGTLQADEWSCQATRCSATVPASGLPGPVDVTVTDGAQRSPVVPAARFTYTEDAPPPAAAPVITAVSPASGHRLGGQQLTLTGDHFTGATSVSFEQRTSTARVSDFAVTDDEHITLTAPSMAVGVHDVVVYTRAGGSALTAATKYTATTGAPTITSVSPATGSAQGGTELTLTGTNLTGASFEVGEEYTTGAVCTPTRCTLTTDPLEPGDRLGRVDVTASNEYGQSAASAGSAFTFTAAPAPVVTGLEPDTGSTAGGDTLVVHGTGLAGGQVSVDGRTASPVGIGGCAPTSCVVRVPAHAAGDVPVTVTTQTGASTGGPAYTYVAQGRPVVTSISPRTAWARGTGSIVVSGHDLNGGKVFFGDQQATTVECTTTQCDVLYAPWADTAGSVQVTVRTPGGTSATGQHTTYTTYTPTITSVSPASGWNDGSARVTVTGTGLKGGRISFANTSAAEKCTEDTTCTVTVPRKAGVTGVVDVEATAEDESTRSPESAAARFTYTSRPLPTITKVEPSRGNPRGRERVTITGTALTQAAITVGANKASDITCEPTRCTFTTPFGAALGKVDVVATTSAGASATGPGSSFEYVASGVPTVTSIAPTTGSTAGGEKIVLTGDDLVDTTIYFGTQYQSADCNRTQCTITTRAGEPGPLQVTAKSTAGTSTRRDVVFTYVDPPRPTITRMTPTTGPASGGTPVTLRGTDLVGAEVEVDGVEVDSRCEGDECTFDAPAGTPGAADVTVVTRGGTSQPQAFRHDPITLSELEIPGVTEETGGGEVTRGIGGDIWFTLRTQDAIGRLEADGSLVTYPAGADSRPGGITLGPDGRMWFSEPDSSHIGAMTGDGTLTEYPVPGGQDDLRYLAAGPDGRVWFTMSSGSVGAITRTGVVTKYQLPDPSVNPYHIAAGPDGRLWFTEYAGTHVGAVTTDGRFSQYELSEPEARSWDIKTGPDGRMWLTQATGPALVAVDPTTGDVEEHRLPGEAVNPQGLELGPDGRFWFTAPSRDRISAWDPQTEELSFYALPDGEGRGLAPKYLAMDGRGDLYATLAEGEGLVRLTGIPDAAPELTHVGPSRAAVGATVTVTGAHLGTTSAVTVGGAAATFSVVDPAHLTVRVPAGSGDAPIRVTTDRGTATAAFGYGTPQAPAPRVSTIDPPSGLVAGGNRITLSGLGLARATVTVGGKAATGVTCTATSCSAVVPAGVLGTVPVVATTAVGSSAPVSYTYLAPAPVAPRVTGVSPATGPTSGGTAVTVTGTGLADGAVWFGPHLAPGSCTATACTVTAPSSGVGAAHVRVATGGGTSPKVAADRFTWTAAGTRASTTTITADRAETEVGEPVTFTVRVSPAAAGGTVTVRDGTTALGTVTLEDGEATFETAALTVGQHRVGAVYGGDATYAGSTAGAPALVTVAAAPQKAATTTTLTAAVDTVSDGSSVQLTARVAPRGATGEVTFTDGAADGDVVARGELEDGVATVTAWLSGPGPHPLVASYEGDARHEPSVSAARTVTVTAFELTETTLTGPATATLGSSVALTATVTPAQARGSVMFLDATKGASLGTATLAGGTATLRTTALGTGRHELIAVFTSTDAAWSGSASDTLVVTVSAPVVTPPPPPPPPPGGGTGCAAAQAAVATATAAVSAATGQVAKAAAKVKALKKKGAAPAKVKKAKAKVKKAKAALGTAQQAQSAAQAAQGPACAG